MGHSIFLSAPHPLRHGEHNVIISRRTLLESNILTTIKGFGISILPTRASLVLYVGEWSTSFNWRIKKCYMQNAKCNFNLLLKLKFLNTRCTSTLYFDHELRKLSYFTTRQWTSKVEPHTTTLAFVNEIFLVMAKFTSMTLSHR